MNLTHLLSKLTKTFFIVGFTFFNYSIGFAQEVESQKSFRQIIFDIGLLPFDRKWIGSNSNGFVDLDFNSSISIKIYNNWHIGLEFYKLLRIPKDQSWTLSEREKFFMIGSMARYYFNNSPLKIYWEGSIDYGNICDCSVYIPYYKRAVFVLPNRYYVGNAIGAELAINPKSSIKLNIKTFYTLNKDENKFLHTRPFLSFSYKFSKKNNQISPIIHNPRL